MPSPATRSELEPAQHPPLVANGGREHRDLKRCAAYELELFGEVKGQSAASRFERLDGLFEQARGRTLWLKGVEHVFKALVPPTCNDTPSRTLGVGPLERRGGPIGTGRPRRPEPD